jgi:uncharacterized membrane protein (DUF485 family)
MAQTTSAPRESATAGAEHHPEIDWVAAEQSPEFRELVHKRRSFVIPALAFVFVWYFGFIALAGYAPDFMGERLIDGFTVGYALALSQFVMTWFLGWLYLRRADRDFDPLARAAAEKALQVGKEGRTAGPRGDGAAREARAGWRFDPDAASRTGEEVRH